MLITYHSKWQEWSSGASVLSGSVRNLLSLIHLKTPEQLQPASIIKSILQGSRHGQVATGGHSPTLCKGFHLGSDPLGTVYFPKSSSGGIWRAYSKCKLSVSQRWVAWVFHVAVLRFTNLNASVYNVRNVDPFSSCAWWSGGARNARVLSMFNPTTQWTC